MKSVAGVFVSPPFFFCFNRPVDIPQIAQLLVALGCPADKSNEMAAQLDKRARQLAAEKKQPYEDALKHLIELMRQGWAAKARGF